MAAILNLTTGIVFLKGWSGTVAGGTLALADGSASLPSMTFAAEPTTGWFRASAGDVELSILGTANYRFTSGNFVNASTGLISWGSSGVGSPDLFVQRDAANTLAQRNGTNAQTFRLYSTFTDASNYERLNVFGQAAGDFVIQPANAGTGTLRPLALGAGGVMQARMYSTALDVNSTNGGSTFWRFNTNAQLLGLTATGGLGYGTGAGGAVTQITSRTTGVTLNTITGDITLFSAAGSATAASFTVTNSNVVATDNIVINEKSGTNLYQTLVTTVGAGSFVVTFYTTGGVAVDAPVFHFSVIKGVSS